MDPKNPPSRTISHFLTFSSIDNPEDSAVSTSEDEVKVDRNARSSERIVERSVVSPVAEVSRRVYHSTIPRR